jgi:hypothetical protein
VRISVDTGCVCACLIVSNYSMLCEDYRGFVPARGCLLHSLRTSWNRGLDSWVAVVCLRANEALKVAGRVSGGFVSIGGGMRYDDVGCI